MRSIALWCLATLVTPVQAEEFTYGTLFHSRAERVSAHATGRPSAAATPTAAAEPDASAPTSSSVLELNGILLSSSGNAVVWINGKPVSDQSVEGGRARPNKHPPGVSLFGPAEHPLELRVGQRVNLASGHIENAYEWRTPPPEEPVLVSASPRPLRLPHLRKPANRHRHARPPVRARLHVPSQELGDDR